MAHGNGTLPCKMLPCAVSRAFLCLCRAPGAHSKPPVSRSDSEATSNTSPKQAGRRGRPTGGRASLEGRRPHSVREHGILWCFLFRYAFLLILLVESFCIEYLSVGESVIDFFLNLEVDREMRWEEKIDQDVYCLFSTKAKLFFLFCRKECQNSFLVSDVLISRRAKASVFFSFNNFFSLPSRFILLACTAGRVLWSLKIYNFL
jgi:hypothetical protein